MFAETRTVAAPDRASARAATVRLSSRRALIGPLVTGGYLLATWHGAHRPAMMLVVAVMIGVAVATWVAAGALGRSRARIAVQCCGMLVNIAGSAALSLLDGGVHSPLGALVPFTLLFYAIMMPPRMYVVAALLSGVGYWIVAVLGGPAPDGYALVYTLGIGGVSYLCLRHAAALAALRRRIADTSRTDALTRCLNRRGFDERLERAVADAAFSGRPVTLIVADLDRFKSINDTWGHAAGDEVLAGTAAIMSQALGDRGRVGRVGGDEFAAVLPNTSPEEAAAVVQRLRAALDAGTPVSIGYASAPAEAATADELRRLADQRAYADKLARPDRAPDEARVHHARDHAGRTPWRRLTGSERRRRTIADIGWLAASDCAVGLLYSVRFAGDSPGQAMMIGLCAAGLLYGVLIAMAAGPLTRWSRAPKTIAASGVLLFAAAIAVPVMDGGVGSSTGLSLLAPMPLIALGLPLVAALPALGFALLAYLAMAAALGAPSAWFVVMHVTGILTVTVVCALQGRAAAQQRRRLTELSRTDALTGLLNRHGFDDRHTATTAGDRPTGLLLIDLDGFKQVNDTYGHAAGDELLRRVADALRGTAEPGDAVARLGGDEFAALLTAGSVAELSARAVRMSAALTPHTRASTGFAVLGTHGVTFADLYAHADEKLYAQKRDHRVPTADPCAAPPPASTSSLDVK
jgi:diguanylate cyclase (GGDEF)-like protein